MFARASPVAALCFGSIYYTEWNGEAAACMCRGIIMKALKKSRSVKPSYLLDEDNHPSGYKSSMALVERSRLHIRTIDWPRYSPGLMPLDFSLWPTSPGACAWRRRRGERRLRASRSACDAKLFERHAARFAPPWSQCGRALSRSLMSRARASP